MDNFHLCSYCLKRQSLGRTRDGTWLGCVVCQKKVDEAVTAFLNNKFGKVKDDGKKKEKSEIS